MESAKPLRVQLPTAGPMEMLMSEAEQEQRGYYRGAGQSPEKHADNFADRVSKTAKQIAEELDLEHYLDD
ncbi:hypothetical protein KDA23_05860 [Candidatus Saccharibacteria bacterium]|nr:hypothetical protein [Candidatus Saccharibacteria bacterium]